MSVAMPEPSAVETEIAVHEKELEDLLGRIMGGPMEPLLARLEEQGRRLVDLEQACQDLAEKELPSICCLIDELGEEFRTGIRRLNADLSQLLTGLQPAIEGLGAKVDSLSEQQAGRVDKLSRDVVCIGGLLKEQDLNRASQLDEWQADWAKTVRRLQQRVLWLSALCATGALAAAGTLVRSFL